MSSQHYNTDTPFELVTDFTPSGDQPAAIEKLVTGINEGVRDQVLLGVTGSGKTFTMAQVVAAIQRPALVLAPNKTLAAQLFSEFRELFPIMQWSILFPTMITINRKPISLLQTLT